MYLLVVLVCVSPVTRCGECFHRLISHPYVFFGEVSLGPFLSQVVFLLFSFLLLYFYQYLNSQISHMVNSCNSSSSNSSNKYIYTTQTPNPQLPLITLYPLLLCLCFLSRPAVSTSHALFIPLMSGLCPQFFLFQHSQS